MKRYFGSEWVKAGYYLSPARRRIESIGKEGGELPGEAGARYFRIPLPILMMVSPILGAAYVILLPVIGIGAILWLVSEKLVAVARTSFAGTESAPNGVRD
jgi:hypothetical protein